MLKYFVCVVSARSTLTQVRQRRFQWQFLVLCLLACAVRSMSQPVSQPGPTIALTSSAGADYLISHWETEQGLPENSATAMVQTPDGYLWFGTFSGLVRFNGEHFQVFDPSNLPQLPGKAIINLHLDARQRLWVSTTLGLAIQEGGRWTNLAANPSWNGNYVRTFSENAGVMCMTSFDGRVARVVDGRIEELPEPPGRKGMGYLGHVDGQGRIWVIQGGYFGHFDGQKWAGSPLTSIAAEGWQGAGQGRDGSFLIVRANEILRVRDGELKSRLSISTTLNDVWGAHETGDGQIWVTSFSEGLFRIEPSGAVAHYTTANGLRHNNSRFVFEDKESNLWVGSSGGGLARFKHRTFLNVGTAQGLRESIVKAVIEESPGKMIIGTFGKGTHAYSGGRISLVHQGAAQTMGSYVQALLKDRQGRLFVATYGNAAHLRDGTGVFRNLGSDDSGGMYVRGLFEDSRGRVWVGGDQSVTRFENGVIQPVVGDNGLRLDGARVFAEDPRNGVMWAARESGLFRMGTNGWEEVRRRTDEAITDVGCLHFEPDGTLWIGGARSGILRLRNSVWSTITVGHGLPTTDITSFLDDGMGYWWMGSNRGVLRVSRSDLGSVADGVLPELPIKLFNTSDGLASAECPGGYNSSAVKSSDGRLWFATLKGVAVVDPRSLRLNTNPPPVLIENVSYFNEDGIRRNLDGPFTESLDIPPGSHDIQVRYTALSYAAPEKMRFAYKIESINENWLDLGNRRVLFFPRGNAGRFTLRIKAANNDAVWNTTGATLALNIQPYYWRTLWFRLVGGSGVMGLVGFVAWRSLQRRTRTRIERAEHARALIEEQARLGVVTEATTDLICFIAPDGRITYINAAGTRLLGFAQAGEVCGRMFVEFFRATQSSRLWQDALAMARKQGSWSGEAALVSRDGQEIPVSQVLVSLAGQVETATAFSIIARDISESKKVEAALRSSEERFTKAFHANPAIIAISTYPEGQIVDINSQFTTFLGFTREDAIGHTALELGAWVFPKQRAELIEALSRQEPVRNVECVLRAKAGDIRTVLASVERLELDRRPCLLFLYQDITTRKLAEEALRNSQQMFEGLVNTIAGIVWEADAQTFQFKFVSPQTERILGHSVSRWLNEPTFWKEHILVDDRDQAVKFCVECTQRGESHTFEYRMIAADGRVVWLRDFVTVIVKDGSPVTLRGLMIDVTARKQIEEAVASSEARLRAIMESLNEGLIVTDLEDRVLDVNPRMLQMTGYSRDEFLGHPAYELLNPESQKEMLDRSARRSRGESESYEMRMWHKDGTHFWAEVNASPLRNARGEIVGTVGANTDITRRREAEMALASSEERFRTLVEGTSVIVWEVSLSTPRHKYVSPQAARLGYPLSDWLQMGFWASHLHPGDQEEAVAYSAREIAAGRIHRHQYRFMAANGSVLWFDDIVNVQTLTGGTRVVRGVMMDITEVKRAAHALEQHRVRLEGIITIDEDMRITVFNPGAERMFQRQESDTLGQPVEILIPEEHRATHAGHVRAFGAGAATSRPMGKFGAINGVKANGEVFPLEAAISMVELEGRKFFTVTCHDVSERVRADQNRLLLEAQLRQAQKLDAIGTLAGGIAHDFNNILGAMMAYTELAISDIGDRAAVLDHLAQVNKGSLRARDLVKQILSFSRKGKSERHPARLQTTIREAMKLMRATIPTTIAIEIKIADDVPHVLADTTQIHQILVNLCTNAAHAMRSVPGRMTVRAGEIIT